MGRRRVHRCLVCGEAIPPGEGVTTRYGGQLLHFRCHTCWVRFEAHPERYLEGRLQGCCDLEPERPSGGSEWTCE
ncbi:MAG: hypothetical protein A2X23_04965 [Chloroflexi bacterium GWC2_73_18]|nr:MAG: hypothetical protein A2X23_04965 [Chloroflexi bacterium GWC2_73_18]